MQNIVVGNTVLLPGYICMDHHTPLCYFYLPWLTSTRAVSAASVLQPLVNSLDSLSLLICARMARDMCPVAVSPWKWSFTYS